MREILFKAKRLDNGQWVQGCLIKHEFDGRVYIGYVFEDMQDGFFDTDLVQVDPETVCQFTGLTDKNGKKIFEGDLLKSPSLINNDDTSPVFFKWNCGCCYGVYGFSCDCFDFSEHAIGMSEVVGNIHDKEE